VADNKILSREQLERRVKEERAAGRTIAFANGCFDLLHVGHVRYLESAAGEGDVLIVAVNDDDSVRALKGAGRPILSATVGPLLTALKPDVHCKGTDYTVDSVPERDVVHAYGGRIAIVGDPKDHSTRDLLARIAGK